MCTRPFDQNIWSSFIYSFFCARPFDQDLGSPLIYFFYLYTTIDKNVWSSFIYSFFCARPLNQKLGSSLIYFFYLSTTIRRNYIVLFRLFFLLCTTIRSKIRVLINLYLFVHNYSTKVRSHSYSLIYYFLHCADILFAIFKAVLPLYFVRSVSASSALIFRPLYS